MAFVNEIPTEQDIEKYDLRAFVNDKDKPLKWRGVWTVDRDRDFHLWGGMSGDQAHGEEVLGKFHFYLAGLKFVVLLEPGGNSARFDESPFFVRWKSIRSISVVRPDLDIQSEIPKAVWGSANEPQELLGNRTLNDFVDILKDGLVQHKADYYNRYVTGPVSVEFEF